MATLSPFKRLLNKLHNELSQDELQCLVHICGEYIPGGQREKISSGWNLFSILIRQNLIGEEPSRMVFLLKIIKESRRGDLVSLVTKYIEENYSEQTETILIDARTSFDRLVSQPRPVILSRPSAPVPVAKCCDVHCGGCNCNCTPCCSSFCCCVIVAILLIFFAVIAALLWYAKPIFPRVNKYLSSDDDLKYTGVVIIAVLTLIAIFCVSCGIYIKRRVDSERLVDDDRNYAASDSTRTNRSARNHDPLRSSLSSVPITASNSYSSLSSALTQ